MDLSTQIEIHLLHVRGWVSTADLCARFKIYDRALRAHGEMPGLCSVFAISGNSGFKHIRYATDTEYEGARKRIFSHFRTEARRLRGWKTRRTQELIGLRPVQQEKFTGQTLLAV